MIFGEAATIVVDGSFHGQNVVNVYHVRVRDAFGLPIATLVNQFCDAPIGIGGVSQVYHLLQRSTDDYRIDRVWAQTAFEEAARDAASLTNLGVGFRAGGINSGPVGIAQFVQFSAVDIPRKFSRGTFFCLTALDQINMDGTLTPTGMSDVDTWAGKMLLWNSILAERWYYYVRNSATTSRSPVDSAQYTPWWTAMERRTLRGQP